MTRKFNLKIIEFWRKKNKHSIRIFEDKKFKVMKNSGFLSPCLYHSYSPLIRFVRSQNWLYSPISIAYFTLTTRLNPSIRRYHFSWNDLDHLSRLLRVHCTLLETRLRFLGGSWMVDDACGSWRSSSSSKNPSLSLLRGVDAHSRSVVSIKFESYDYEERNFERRNLH